jgi:hypothetical protein
MRDEEDILNELNMDQPLSYAAPGAVSFGDPNQQRQ